MYEMQKLSDLIKVEISHSSFEEKKRVNIMKKLSNGTENIDLILIGISKILFESNQLRPIFIELKREINEIKDVLTKFSSQLTKGNRLFNIPLTIK